MNFSRKWLNYFFTVAEDISKISRDPSTKVGAIVINKNKRILSTGYNGFPQGVDDSPDKYLDRTYKLAHVCHAEANCICQAASFGVGLSDAIIFVTLAPCIECAKLIIQSGIKCVVFKDRDLQARRSVSELEWRDKINASFEMLNEAGVEIYKYNVESSVLSDFQKDTSVIIE